MPSIHPTAIVEPGAELGDSVEVGPFCHIGAEVSIAGDSQLLSHVSISGRTRLGSGCKVFPFASIGQIPQDLKYDGEPSELVVGEGTTIREHVTINTGTKGGGMTTRVGSGCLLMVGAHVAHDCQIGNRVILANNATLAGHVVLGDGVIIGGMSAVLQFVRIGENAMIGGMSGVEQDVIPYGIAKGNRARLSGLNLVGLKRGKVTPEEMRHLKAAYDELFGDAADTLSERAHRLHDTVLAGSLPDGRVRTLLEFILEPSQHGICRPA